MVSKNPIISIRGLVTQFGNQRVHDHLDLDIFKGEILGIVGGSGAGKSVLMGAILGLTPIREGTITVLGQQAGTLERITKLHLQSHWGVLFQGGALFSSLTVGENIQIPMKDMEKMPDELSLEMASIKLKMVGLQEEDFFKYPSELSGGMKKRVAIARALSMTPSIILADEPTGNISSAQSDEIMKIFQKLQKEGHTIVIITHEPSVARWAERIIHIQDGKIVKNEKNKKESANGI